MTIGLIVKKYFPQINNLILFLIEDRNYNMQKLTVLEQKIARHIQSDILITSRPFRKIADDCTLTEDEVLKTTKNLLHNGVIRKFSAVLRHQKAGYNKNALVVWSVPPGQIKDAGEKMTAYKFVSHCYERNPTFRGKYNLFTMIHSKEENISTIVGKIALSSGINDYLILESTQEYKKTSPEYFT
jgi:siroheme decarboxylase